MEKSRESTGFEAPGQQYSTGFGARTSVTASSTKQSTGFGDVRQKPVAGQSSGCCGKKSKQQDQFLNIEPSDRIPEAKVIFVGSNGVGKTSIIKKFIDGSFNRGEAPGAGAANYHKVVEVDVNDNVIKINLNIWDTAGQE